MVFSFIFTSVTSFSLFLILPHMMRLMLTLTSHYSLSFFSSISISFTIQLCYCSIDKFCYWIMAVLYDPEMEVSFVIFYCRFVLQ